MATFPSKNFEEQYKEQKREVDQQLLLEQQAKANKQHHQLVETLNPPGW
ncbi:hypothetical protein [Serratia fonticola]|uniref:Uncharacterized protein n=1 Tax=Serratia fonticola TaxID=47917 RepID=A0ABY9PGJ3_SERFO|nr:hypothetical protein [Serratia fonticola]WMT12535.1 hypothetical protein RFB13_14790 [Serratia fonticola]